MNKLYSLLADYPYSNALGLGFVLAGILYFSPIYDDGSAIDNQLSTVEAQLNNEAERKKDTDLTLKQVHEMQEKVGRLSTQFQEISKRLPTVLTSIEINKAIDEFGRNAGVKIKNKKPGVILRHEVVEEIPVTINVEGTYNELAQFVYLVSSAQRMARIKDITIYSQFSDGRISQNLIFDATVVGYKSGEYKAGDDKSKLESKQ